MKTRMDLAKERIAVVDERPRGRPTAVEGLRRVSRICRQLFGIPDYERYLEHAAEHHAGAPVMSRQEYFNRAIDRRYGKAGPRCC